MSTKVIRATGANVSPAEDARLYRQMFSQDGLFNSIEITARGGNQIYIPAMYGILEGRDFTTDPMTIEAELPSSSTGSGVIYIRFDTTTDNIISVNAELTESYTPTYEDINAGGTICDMVIGTYTATATQVTSVVQYDVKAGFGGKMEKTLETGETSLSFTNPLFDDDTYFNIHTDSPLVSARSWTFSNHTFTLTFYAQPEAHKIGVVFRNFI